ncbi:hypothetical protein [Kineosporia sp. NBRC 101731]|uniref:hypothetical protein n=1 Tax=Kineosporia sp. NBRC 101731 TaxID=3032199 RepID=UPI0024A3856B|nr:hypothetical protein [Kineosporia sp. NBRC 101731]GLY26714.1 hypothetical protein Kisp02_00790 [Kineosporia sp. NBRC 101731]
MNGVDGVTGPEDPEGFEGSEILEGIEALEALEGLMGLEKEREVTVWAEGTLTVTATLEEGSLVILGEDTDAAALFGEDVSQYEYGITVAPGDVPAVLDALDVAEGVDVLDALVLRGEDLVKIGEAGWLESIGVQAEFWSRIS